ncbi:hypothetical protein DDB_G0282701 [Dictyostelium discoideum AX4]|uniref:DUF7949 domain-containing protein n=1 Tax=Dictyostelium discoideum TaxID=44689 RepID=Q54S26_DICDI|nr:hypothetical protein DDB_G0282701 [Dictyostelium discoideum AX4]EAL66210.1 hypothetical protein DDB_G0282701 [Dictyostelium discoideum AX4]|eukprot:XP_640213.1 hypothetical protein DDB_G0282701 [Dictyostelium discoideum AX4]
MVSRLSFLFIFFFYFVLIKATPTTTPTDSLQNCQGNPICGGPEQGYCFENSCVCYSPYVGLDCTSKVIIIPTPISSQEAPNTEIDDDSNSEYVILITEIRELDFDGKTVTSHILTNWGIIGNLNNISYYQTTILQGGVTTRVNVTKELLEDQELTKIKYSVNLSQYAFQSALNVLQIIFKVQVQLNETSNTTICSSKEYAFTTQPDDSSYVRLQVANSTLLSRFPNSCFADAKIISTSSISLDSGDLKSKANNVESHIGISIPNYQSWIIFDSDFSFSLGKAANSNSPNSVCSPSEESQSSSSPSSSLSENSESSLTSSSSSSSLSSFLFKGQFVKIITVFIFLIIIC